MKKNVISIIVFVLMVLTTIAVDAAMIVWAVDSYDIYATMFTFATVLGTAAFDINYLKNFALD